MKNKYAYLIFGISIISFSLVVFFVKKQNSDIEADNGEKDVWSSRKTRVKSGKKNFMKPDGFIEYFNATSKRIGETNSSYNKGYRGKELAKITRLQQRNTAKRPFEAEFIARGPSNVGGRTRAIAVDPDDETHCTWIAGAASGGLWRTADCGLTWTNISAGLPNLSTNSIAQAASNPDILYVGTGEVFAGNASFVRGDGIYKSTDRGNTWNLLESTVDNTNYISVNRIAVDPSDESIVVIATNTGIFKSEDGGTSWEEKLDADNLGSVQDLQVDPSNYNIQYAGVNAQGIYKSVNAGNSWSKSSEGIAEGERFEVTIAPSNTDIIYTSTEAEGTNTVLYLSEDKGQNWVKVIDSDYETNFLGGQGWYDNSIAVNPYNPYEVYVGGVNIGKYVVNPSNIGESERQFLGIDIENAGFLSFVDFNASFENGTLNISDGTNSSSENPVTVEIRFGDNNAQKAHRFTVPSGATAGVASADYMYQDYSEVPFEVWDVENDRQLMVSYRDQENNGIFNLNARIDSDEDLSDAREYIYIHDIAYNENAADANVAQNGGFDFFNMYFFWPVLTDGASWNPAIFENAIMTINYGSQLIAEADAVAIYDAYGNFENQNISNLHPDHHNLTFIKTDEKNESFMIINGNDGGFGFSIDNGATFEERESGYVTSQFYGADKKPGEIKYIGGMQDNGTYVSSGSTVDETSIYNFEIGGDGFEVIWHATDPNLVIGGSQFNGFARSTDGGDSFIRNRTGLADDGPFISRLAGSNSSPDVIYALGASGLYKSTNFGESWVSKPITQNTWRGDASAADVEVSLANDQIVWAGAGMFEGTLDIFVSVDAGENFNTVNIPDSDPEAFTTGIYTHPKEDSTAYLLFSVANQAKIYKTTDLGQNWDDISGFAEGETESTRGFPDVYVHSLLVMPFNTDIIWVGTEIGLFESLDGGASWNIRNEVPSVSIWSMKVVDDQVVLGTYGRGIWTATIEELRYGLLRVQEFAYTGYGKASFEIDLPVQYDNLVILIGDEIIENIESPEVGKSTFEIDDFTALNGGSITIIGTAIGSEFRFNYTIQPINVAPEVLNFSVEYLSDGVYPVNLVLENNEPFEKVEVYFNGALVHSDTQVLAETDPPREIEFIYDQQARNTTSIKAYLNGQEYTTNLEDLIVTNNRLKFDNDLILYPNPTRNFIQLSGNIEDVRSIKMYSSAGKLVARYNREQIQQIDVSNLDQGIYLLQIENNLGRLLSKRFVKE